MQIIPVALTHQLPVVTFSFFFSTTPAGFLNDFSPNFAPAVKTFMALKVSPNDNEKNKEIKQAVTNKKKHDSHPS